MERFQEQLSGIQAALRQKRVSGIAEWMAEVGRAKTKEDALADLAGRGEGDIERLGCLMDEYRKERIAKTVEEAQRAGRERAYRDFLETVPARYRDASLDDFKGSPFEDEIGAMVGGESRLILGTLGIGKTRLAWALAKEWRWNGKSAEVIKAQVLLSRCKGWQGEDADIYRRIKDEFGRGLSLLIIDEIDKIYGSQADFLLLSFLVDARYEECLQTIVMGNKPADRGVADLLGMSSFSRLSGDGAAARYIVGPDRRKEDGAIG